MSFFVFSLSDVLADDRGEEDGSEDDDRDGPVGETATGCTVAGGVAKVAVALGVRGALVAIAAIHTLGGIGARSGKI